MKLEPTTAGERTQEIEHNFSPQDTNPFFFKDKTAEQWYSLHEIMRKDFERVLREKETLDRLANQLKAERVTEKQSETEKELLEFIKRLSRESRILQFVYTVRDVAIGTGNIELQKRAEKLLQ